MPMFIGQIQNPIQPRRLLDVADVIPDELLDPQNPQRWLEGVSWEPSTCASLATTAADACSDNFFTSTARGCAESLTQTPFRVEDKFQMSTLDGDSDSILSRLQANWDAHISAAFAGELLSGASSGGISLSSEATAPASLAFGSAAVPVWKAVAVLEEELADRVANSVAWLHIAPGLLAQAVGSYGLVLDERGRWITPAGNIVVTDAGYNSPPPPAGQAAASAGESWVYASGPILHKATSMMLASDITITNNKVTAWVEGYGLLLFDPCMVSAVLASYALEG